MIGERRVGGVGQVIDEDDGTAGIFSGAKFGLFTKLQIALKIAISSDLTKGPCHAAKVARWLLAAHGGNAVQSMWASNWKTGFS
jgi:hypothetical protein